MFALTGATASWIADQDYALIGAVVSGSGNSWKFGFDKVNPAVVGTTAVYLDTTILSGPTVTNTAPQITGIRIPVPSKATLYLVNNTAGSMGVNVFLEA